MKLKFFSITRIIQNTKIVVIRFPLATVIAIVGTIIAILLLHTKTPPFYYADIFTKILLILIMAFPLSVAVVLFGEQNLPKHEYRIIANIAVIVFAVVYYLLSPVNFFKIENIFLMHYFMWIISFLLMLTFISFLRKQREENDTFWHYNCVLFWSVILTMAYGTFIQIGLSIALSSVKFLFKFAINDKRYMELWIVVIGIFSPIFFLSRIPKNIPQLPKTDFYPRELRLFSQYVLVPLVIVYFLILYAYVAKILIIWDWPEGRLEYMILGFSFLGMMTYVILYPLREKVDWIRKFGQIFYLILIPQVGMIFWSLRFRIMQYGITEKRYFVFVFGLWLLGIGLYFLISKKKNIRLIPIAIAIIIIICSFGPWGAFAVSKNNQIGRLKKLLTKNNILVDDKVKKSEKQVSFDDRKEISAITRYLINYHGVNTLQSWFNQDLSLLKDNKKDEYDRKNFLPKKIVNDFLGITYVEQWENKDTVSKHFYLNTYQFQKKILDISKYSYMTTLHANSTNIGKIGGYEYKFLMDTNTSKLFIFKNGSIFTTVELEEFLENIIEHYFQAGKDNFNQDKMKILHEDENIKLALYLSTISGVKKEESKYDLQNIEGILLFSLKENAR